MPGTEIPVAPVLQTSVSNVAVDFRRSGADIPGVDSTPPHPPAATPMHDPHTHAHTRPRPRGERRA